MHRGRAVVQLDGSARRPAFHRTLQRTKSVSPKRPDGKWFAAGAPHSCARLGSTADPVLVADTDVSKSAVDRVLRFPVSPLFVAGDSPTYTAPDLTVVIVQPPALILEKEAKEDRRPEPIRSTLLEVKDTVAPPLLASDPPGAFVIVERSGAEHLATAVVAQGDSVYYVDTQERHRRIPLRDVDRERTRERNREKKLVLRLPPY